jgi:hypothetical protein
LPGIHVGDFDGGAFMYVDVIAFFGPESQVGELVVIPYL